MAKLVKAGVTLRDQINEAFPNRDKRSDGWVGDSAHAARKSDHNPDKNGWVHAIDIDEHLLGKDKGQNLARELADQLIEYARERKDGGRLKYVVYENAIASSTYKNKFWTWRNGNWGHTQHIHVSFTSKAQEDGSKFDLPIFGGKGSDKLWDGTIPEYDNIVAAMEDPSLKNLATYRLACRLHDLGFFEGEPIKYEQGYPWKAVEAWQKSKKYRIKTAGKYNLKDHKQIFGE